jgi:DivIVA domain-containing protein
MDVSPKTLREVEFREKMRGYHPEDVDQFLEQAAASFEVLQDRLRQAIERAQRAEQAATEAGGNDDALRRTLLLAQRTADLAVQEAREQAARIIASAEQQTQGAVAETDQRVHSLIADAEHRAQSTLADAEQRAQAMLTDAEHRARRGHEETLTQIRNEVSRLEVTRQRLQMDAETLARWVAEHRSQLRAALEDALTRVDQIDLSPPPPVRAPYPVDTPTTSVAPVEVAAAHAAPVVEQQPAAPRPAHEQQQWAPPPAQAAAPVAEDQNGEADPYFAELRRAINDPDPLAPRPGGEHQAAAGGPAADNDEP